MEERAHEGLLGEGKFLSRGRAGASEAQGRATGHVGVPPPGPFDRPQVGGELLRLDCREVVQPSSDLSNPAPFRRVVGDCLDATSRVPQEKLQDSGFVRGKKRFARCPQFSPQPEALCPYREAKVESPPSPLRDKVHRGQLIEGDLLPLDPEYLRNQGNERVEQIHVGSSQPATIDVDEPGGGVGLQTLAATYAEADSCQPGRDCVPLHAIQLGERKVVPAVTPNESLMKSEARTGRHGLISSLGLFVPLPSHQR